MAGGRADRTGRVSIRESNAGSGQSIDMGCLIARTTLAAEIHPSQVIDEDEDHIGFLAGTCEAIEQEKSSASDTKIGE